jgi:hypothetical protein
MSNLILMCKNQKINFIHQRWSTLVTRKKMKKNFQRTPVRQLPARLRHMTKLLCHMPKLLCHMPKLLCHMPKVLCHMPKLLCHMSKLLCHMPKLLCHMPKLLCHMPKLLCHMPKELRHMPILLPQLRNRPLRLFFWKTSPFFLHLVPSRPRGLCLRETLKTFFLNVRGEVWGETVSWGRIEKNKYRKE